MNRLLRFTFALLALTFMIGFMTTGVASATKYYIAANGNDANSGTSNTTPWQHAPGMPNCKSTCAGAAIQAGDSIIFRGGDTWHFGNSSLTPYVGGQSWNFSHSGSTGSPIYIGVDQTWYAGSSWARPLFSGDDAITTNTVNSCTYDFNNINVVLLGTDNHIRLDNIEMSGFCYSGQSGVNAGFVNFGGTDAIIENMYFHGMTIQTDLTDDEQVAIHGSGNGFKADLTNQCIYNVFDNSDGSLGNSGTYPNGKASMEAIQNACAVVAFSVFNRVSNGMVSSTSSVHDNLFHDMYEPQGSVHGNIWNVNNDGLTPLGNQLFYNNVMYNINEGVGIWFEQNPAGYYFNNVSWNISNSANCLRVGGSNVTTMLPVTTMYIYNNTWDAPCTVRGTAPSPGGDPAQNGPVYFQNNHLIGFGITSFSTGTGVLYNCDAGAICTWTDNGSELFQTEAAANAQGYTQANSYAPSSGGSTIGAGANLSTLCNVFSPDSEFCGGTSDGANEKGSNGGEVASNPAIPMIPRQTSWDIGAYKFGSGNAPAPPTGLTASVQ
jgi:hypothetical protein